jgi:hypothetical protein
LWDETEAWFKHLSNNRRAQCAQLFLAGNPIQQDATDSFEYAKDYVFDRLDVAFPTLNTRVHLKCGTCKFDKELASRRDRVIMCQYFSDARIRSWRIYGKWIKESYANNNSHPVEHMSIPTPPKWIMA